MSDHTRKNKYKGKVGITSDRGALRLNLPRFLQNGKQQYLYLSLPDTPENRKLAAARAMQIESDIKLDRFDPTLNRYRPQVATPPSALGTLDVLRNWIAARSPQVAPGTRANYQKSIRILARSPFSDFPATAWDLPAIAQFSDWLEQETGPTLAIALTKHLSAAYKWAIARGELATNPWRDAAANLRRGRGRKKQDIDPFSADERDRIIGEFEANHSHYSPIIKFLFFSGCRPSEAIALTWNQITEDAINFEEAITEDERGRYRKKSGLKTQPRRQFPINGQLREILGSRSVGLIFTGKRGGPVSLRYLRKIWARVLEACKIRFRKIYQTRHTFITHCLFKGVPVSVLGAWVGNSPEIIFRHYAGPGRGILPPKL